MIFDVRYDCCLSRLNHMTPMRSWVKLRTDCGTCLPWFQTASRFDIRIDAQPLLGTFGPFKTHFSHSQTFIFLCPLTMSNSGYTVQELQKNSAIFCHFLKIKSKSQSVISTISNLCLIDRNVFFFVLRSLHTESVILPPKLSSVKKKKKKVFLYP